MAERPARRRKPSKPVEQLKTEIDARDRAKKERAEERKKSKSMTPAERHEQEKAERAKKGSRGYGYSAHLMGGSSSSSGFNPRSVREELLVDYLLEEGFASDEKSAYAIASAMSEEWKQSIAEGAVPMPTLKGTEGAVRKKPVPMPTLKGTEGAVRKKPVPIRTI